MRILIVLAIAAVSAGAQSPRVRLINATRPGSVDFQVGDRFEIVVAGGSNQPVSVRTTRHTLKTDWGPIIGSTDATGLWSATGQFEKADFGSWHEVWTVGGKLANPVVSFSVDGPCLPGGLGSIQTSGPNEVLNCLTAMGQQTFITPSSGDSYRTPDGRIIAGDVTSNMTADEYLMEVMEVVIGRRDGEVPGKVAAKAGELILKMVGVNALTEAETRKVLTIVRDAYEPGQFHAPATAKLGMLDLLAHLAVEAEQESLKQEIAQTIDFVQAQ